MALGGMKGKKCSHCGGTGLAKDLEPTGTKKTGDMLMKDKIQKKMDSIKEAHR